MWSAAATLPGMPLRAAWRGLGLSPRPVCSVLCGVFPLRGKCAFRARSVLCSEISHFPPFTEGFGLIFAPVLLFRPVSAAARVPGAISGLSMPCRFRVVFAFMKMPFGDAENGFRGTDLGRFAARIRLAEKRENRTLERAAPRANFYVSLTIPDYARGCCKALCWHRYRSSADGYRPRSDGNTWSFSCMYIPAVLYVHLVAS